MNIEKTISEHAVSDILTPMLESQDRIVTEDVAPLFDKATGLDTPPASGTVTTTIEESRSVITAIIRKAWTAPLTMLLGASVIGYITAAYTYLRNRLQGNETYGIPDRRSEISASSPLAANLALLNDRKIGGVPEAVDGISLVHMLSSSAAYNTITELTDPTTGWLMNKALPVRSYFPNCIKATIGCGEVNVYFDNNGGWILSSDCEYHFPNLKKITPTTSGVGYGHGLFNGNVLTHDIYCPELEEIAGGSFFGLIRMSQTTNMSGISVYLPKLRKVGSGSAIFSRYNDSTLGIVKLVLGKIETNNFQPYYVYGTPVSTPKLRHLEIGAGTAVSLNFQYWVPDSETLAHQDFLPNFRSFIALRLTDNGSGKTLTLSQAVRNAIHAAEATYGIENIIITQKGWTISPAPN